MAFRVIYASLSISAALVLPPQPQSAPARDESGTSEVLDFQNDLDNSKLSDDGEGLHNERYAYGSTNPISNKTVITIGIGSQKCGTTLMSIILGQHPEVLMGIKKELHWFANDRDKIESTSNCAGPRSLTGPLYKRFLRECFEEHQPNGKQALLDFSPRYGRLFAGNKEPAETLELLVSNLKSISKDAEVRLIAVLCDPVQRAASKVSMDRWSNIHDMKSASDWDLNMHLWRALKATQKGSGDPIAEDVTAGYHEKMLKGVLTYFSPSQLLVVNSVALEDVATYKKLFQHMGVDALSDSTIENNIKNMQKATKNSQKDHGTFVLEDKLGVALKNHYVSHNEALWKLMGTKPWW